MNFPLEGTTTARGAWADSGLPASSWGHPWQAQSRGQEWVLVLMGSFPVRGPLEACSEVKGRLGNRSLVAWVDECYVGGSGWALGGQCVHSASQLT